MFFSLFAIVKRRRRFFYTLFTQRHRKQINKKKEQQITRNFKFAIYNLIFKMHVVENYFENLIVQLDNLIY